MNRILEEVLENKHGNYILPFFWLHGESEEVLREYMGAIQNCGIRAVCLESRPHPDFVGELWWHDLDIILDEARNRDMKVWILDDAHFPTGQAAGKMKDAEPHLRKEYIMINKAEVYGPMPQVFFPVKEMAATKPNLLDMLLQPPINADTEKKWFNDDELLKVVASRVVEGDDVDDTLLDLTNNVKDGELYWDVPNGLWRVFVLYKTHNGGGKSDYINMLDEESCRVQIDAVYEPHYARYKDEFGKTIAGFFSDEPCVGNTYGSNLDESIGKKMMHLPWSKEMPKMLEERLGSDYLKQLIALWTRVGDDNFTAKVRYAYMDSATQLIGKNFSIQLGKWCEEHNVEYIGHIVEDGNQHTRFGSSQGHFFRSMLGQHMSGIDDIGGQVLPEGDYSKRPPALAPGIDGEFYHFELGKLGASFAQIDPKKKGRTMCEIFGAYGWSEGVRLMKYLTDHFLVRGINYFVPHAFSAKEFPDQDCPPHFYANGNDPQYKHFAELMKYMNRMCHLFQDGKHVSTVAMLYHGDAEWTGKCMFNQKPARELLENQIDFDIIPSDVFINEAYFCTGFDGKLKINEREYEAFVIPYTQYITSFTANYIIKMLEKDFPVIFVNNYPDGICNEQNINEDNASIEKIKELGAKVVPLKELSMYLRKENLFDVSLENEFKKLRVYHYKRENIEFYMFYNESMSDTFDSKVKIKTQGNLSIYDAIDNEIYKVAYNDEGNAQCVKLKLLPGQSIVLVCDESCKTEKLKIDLIGNVTNLSGEWNVFISEAKEYPIKKEVAVMDTLYNFGKIMRDFSGFIIYEKQFDYKESITGDEILYIEDAYEGVELFINDSCIGKRFCKPYIFAIGKYLNNGNNTIRIEVATTLQRKVFYSGQGGFFSGTGPLEPTGIVGEVKIFKGEE